MHNSRKQALTQSQSYWLNHLKSAEREGVTVSEYARAHGLNLKSLYNQKNQLRQKGLYDAVTKESGPFIQVRPATGSRGSAPVVTGVGKHVVQLPNGARIEVDAGAVGLSELIAMAASV